MKLNRLFRGLLGLTLVAGAAPVWAGGISLAAPQNLSATGLDRQIVVSFTYNNSPGDISTCSTTIEYSTNATDFVALSPADGTSPISLTTDSTAGRAALVNGTAYSVSLRPASEVGACDDSNPASVSAPVTVTPTLRPQPSDMVADLVLGQADFAGAAINRGGAVAANTLNNPRGIAVDRSVTPNRVYITDTFNNRVLVWNDISALMNGGNATSVLGQGGSFTTSASSASSTGLNFPIDAVVDSAGNLYVADSGTNRVLRFNKPLCTADCGTGGGDTTADVVWGQPDFVTTSSGTTSQKLSGAFGVALDSAGNLYVADASNNRVLRFDGATAATPDTTADAVFGQSVFTSKTSGLSQAGMNLPTGVAVDPAGNLYVVENTNHRVLRFANASTSGATLNNAVAPSAVGVFGQDDFTTGSSGTGAKFNGPTRVTLDNNGALYVSDGANNRVVRFDLPSVRTTGAAPAPDAEFGGTTTADDRKIGGPFAVAVDSSGHLYASSTTHNRVLRFNAVSPNANGVCATNVAASAAAPSAGLCTTGTATTVSSTGGVWKWGCNGTGTGTSTEANACSSPFQTQTITLSANPTSLFVEGTSAISASSTSGLTPALSSTTTSACTLANSTVTGVAPGTCTVAANLAKSTDGCASCYQAAAEQSVSLAVTKQNQTITPITAGSNPLLFTSTTTVSATADSGLGVSFGTSTPAVCSVSAVQNLAIAIPMIWPKAINAGGQATVTPITAGTCTVTAAQAGNNAYNAATSQTLNITITAVAPAVPTGLMVTPGDERATISFTPGSNGGSPITNYEFALDSDVFLAFSPAVTASPVTIFGLTNGTQHTIRLRAVNAVGTSATSAAVMATPVIPLAQAPMQVSGTAGVAQVTLVFTAPAGAITDYEVSYNGGETYTSLGLVTSPLTLGNLINNVTYAIKLRAVNGAGPGPASATLNLTPLADDDVDGVPSTIEDPVPNANGTGSGDGNGDGLNDSTQLSVVSLPEQGGRHYLTLVSTAGATLSNTSAVAAPVDLPQQQGRLFGAVSFTLSGVAAGSTQSFELYVPKNLGVVTALLKKNLATGVWDSLPITVTEVGSKTRIVYSLTDGGDYDSDRIINGSISDPVFVLGTPSASVTGGGSFGWLTLVPLAAMALRRRRRLH